MTIHHPENHLVFPLYPLLNLLPLLPLHLRSDIVTNDPLLHTHNPQYHRESNLVDYLVQEPLVLIHPLNLLLKGILKHTNKRLTPFTVPPTPKLHSSLLLNNLFLEPPSHQP